MQSIVGYKKHPLMKPNKKTSSSRPTDRLDNNDPADQPNYPKQTTSGNRSPTIGHPRKQPTNSRAGSQTIKMDRSLNPRKLEQ
jgi:hypothetical protein